MTKPSFLLCFVCSLIGAVPVGSADRLLGVQSARVMSQSMPWIAQETGIFRKYNLEFPAGLYRHIAAGDGRRCSVAMHRY
jgi:hypothetical protein